MTDLDKSTDLELRVAGTTEAWTLSLRLTRPEDGADVERGPFPTALEPTALLALAGDPAAYGAALRAMLFAGQGAVAAFAEARAITLDAGRQLRLRLHVPPPLQHLRWETLIDPCSGRPLALEGALLLSRYLSGDDYQPVYRGPRPATRTLIAVAAPVDVAHFGLAPVERAVELRRVGDAIGDMGPTVTLGSAGEPVTWEALQAELLRGYDIFYLVAHGALLAGQPILYLERSDGTTAPTSGVPLADLVRALSARRPRLVVLASCASAGDGYADALAALGPQLARAGVPAVLAMQGRLSVGSNARFQAAFFGELMRDGLVDRAVSIARHAIHQEPDWWMPVLYTRLRTGRIWGGDEPAGAYVEQRRLDAAMPAQATVGVPSEIWVQICLAGSAGFRAQLPSHTRFGDEISAADVNETALPLLFPQGPDGEPQPLKLRIELDAPDFKLNEPLIETLLLPRQDTARLIFNLTPTRARRRSRVHIAVRQLQPDGSLAIVGSAAVETSILSRGAGLVAQIAWNLTSIAMAVAVVGGPQGKDGPAANRGDHGAPDAPRTTEAGSNISSRNNSIVEVGALNKSVVYSNSVVYSIPSTQQASPGLRKQVTRDTPAPRFPPKGGPLRILALTPDAATSAPARAREQAERAMAWAKLGARGDIVVDEIAPVTPSALADYLAGGPQPHIVHFAGQGRYADAQWWLVLDDGHGGEVQMPVDGSASRFGSPQLVVLCPPESTSHTQPGQLTELTEALCSAGVRAVLALPPALGSAWAGPFTASLYSSLAYGEALQRAVELAWADSAGKQADEDPYHVLPLALATRRPARYYLFAP